MKRSKTDQGQYVRNDQTQYFYGFDSSDYSKVLDQLSLSRERLKQANKADTSGQTLKYYKSPYNINKQYTEIGKATPGRDAGSTLPIEIRASIPYELAVQQIGGKYKKNLDVHVSYDPLTEAGILPIAGAELFQQNAGANTLAPAQLALPATPTQGLIQAPPPGVVPRPILDIFLSDPGKLIDPSNKIVVPIDYIWRTFQKLADGEDPLYDPANDQFHGVDISSMSVADKKRLDSLIGDIEINEFITKNDPTLLTSLDEFLDVVNFIVKITGGQTPQGEANRQSEVDRLIRLILAKYRTGNIDDGTNVRQTNVPVGYGLIPEGSPVFPKYRQIVLPKFDGKFGDIYIDPGELRKGILQVHESKGSGILIKSPLPHPDLAYLVSRKKIKNMEFDPEALRQYKKLADYAHVNSLSGKGTIDRMKKYDSMGLPDAKMKERLKVLMGLFDAGNKSPDVKNEISALVDQMARQGQISKMDKRKLLDMYSVRK